MSDLVGPLSISDQRLAIHLVQQADRIARDILEGEPYSRLHQSAIMFLSASRGFTDRHHRPSYKPNETGTETI